jgi:hypothetical protein
VVEQVLERQWKRQGPVGSLVRAAGLIGALLDSQRVFERRDQKATRGLGQQLVGANDHLVDRGVVGDS